MRIVAPETPPRKAGRQSRLLTLPLEIRESILIYALAETDTRLIHPNSRPPWAELYRCKPGPSPPILSVCHQLYAECQQVLCRGARLVVYPQAETVPQLSLLGIRTFVRYLDIAIPLLEQDSRISVRRKATTLLASPPEKLVGKLAATFPCVEAITLTLCPMLSRSLAILPYMTGRRNYELKALLTQRWCREKVNKVRMQLDQKMTAEVLGLVQAAGNGSVDGRPATLEMLQRKLGHVKELSSMREFELYFTTPLSRPSHNRPIIWTLQQQQAEAAGQSVTTTASSAMLTRHLRTERQKMEGTFEVLREILPQVRKLRLFRMLYWRGTVTYEVIDLTSSSEAEVQKLLKRRTIGGSAETAHELLTPSLRGDD